MKRFVLASPISFKRLKVLCVLAMVELLSIIPGCSLSAKPSKTVDTLCRAVESGDVDRAATLFSSGLINRVGIQALKQDLLGGVAELKEHGGIKSIRVVKEDVVGDVAEVMVEIT